MLNSRIFFSASICIAVILLLSLQAAAQDNGNSEIDEMIKAVCTDSQKGAISDYSYQLRISYLRKKSGFDTKFKRLYQAILPSSNTLTRYKRHPFILLEDSRKHITPQDVRNMRQQLSDQLIRMETVAAEKPVEETSQKNEDGGYWTINFAADGQNIKINILKLLENSDFSDLEHKTLDNRKVATVDFISKPTADSDGSLSYIGKIEGRIWIDETSKRVVRLEAFPIGKFIENKNKSDLDRQESAVLFFTQTQVREGFWFPRNVTLDFTKSPKLFNAVRLEFDFINYRKPTVEVNGTNIDYPTQTDDFDPQNSPE